eukprot:scaffold3910_cov182-Amphora_coffeaeformis.AAC.9
MCRGKDKIGMNERSTAAEFTLVIQSYIIWISLRIGNHTTNNSTTLIKIRTTMAHVVVVVLGTPRILHVGGKSSCHGGENRPKEE